MAPPALPSRHPAGAQVQRCISAARLACCFARCHQCSVVLWLMDGERAAPCAVAALACEVCSDRLAAGCWPSVVCMQSSLCIVQAGAPASRTLGASRMRKVAASSPRRMGGCSADISALVLFMTWIRPASLTVSVARAASMQRHSVSQWPAPPPPPAGPPPPARPGPSVTAARSCHTWHPALPRLCPGSALALPS